MLLRLRVRGFKNLRDVSVRFGPLTCFVGPNGVGKSNLFDALQFLSALADHDVQTAAESVRSPTTGAFWPRDLFWNTATREEMAFEADIIVPAQVVDDFGRSAQPKTTLLRYEIALRHVDDPVPRLELVRESLAPLAPGDARALVGFPHSGAFREALIKGTRRKGHFVSTSTVGGQQRLMLHQDGGSRGQPIPAGLSPRTVVGGTNAAEYPTVLAARREMSSWRSLQLEPSVMRAPDPLGSAARVDEHGGHIAATLQRLAQGDEHPGQTLSEAANRLAALVPEVRELSIDRDEARQQLSIRATLAGCPHPLGPRALSDGTLRFLALVTMQLDGNADGLLCLEEPENGIHPARIPAMIDLLRDFAVDPMRPVGADNPARQIVLNTHSPEVVRQLDLDDVLFVDTVDDVSGHAAIVLPVDGGWRRERRHAPARQFADFVGGSPVGEPLRSRQLRLDFGTAS